MNCAGGATECSPARERWVSSRQSPQPQRGERLVRSTSFGPLGLIPFPNSYPALTRWATFCRAYGAETVSTVAIRSHLLQPAPTFHSELCLHKMQLIHKQKFAG